MIHLVMFPQDLRYALRMVAKNPGFSLIAVLTLGVGIGVNTSIFSVLNGVLLRPLPYPESGRLMLLEERSPTFDHMSLSYPNFLDWRARNRTFTDMAAYRGEDFTLTGAGDPERLRGRMVSASFFAVLGVRPVLGRFFTPQDDELGGAPAAAISEALWKRRFGGDPRAIGRALRLSGKSYTLVGIVPGDFHYGSYDVYVPIGQWTDPIARKREFHPGIRAVGRLKPGVSIEQARADLNAIARRLAELYPANIANSASVTRLKEYLVGEVRPVLWVLFVAVAFVLLIACVNVANLLLARSTVRQKEIAIRTALGARRGDVVRQLLIESVLLALLGGALGLVLAAWGTDALVAAVPHGLPRVEEIAVDSRVLGFTLLASLLTGLLFGLAPALATSSADPSAVLKEFGRGSVGGRSRFRDALVVAEMALALVLLAGAGLMIRSIARLHAVNPGFDPAGVVSFQVGLSHARTASAGAVRLSLPHLLDRIKSIPGVRSAAITMDLVYSDDDEMPFWVQGQRRPASMSEMQWAMFYPVSPDYLSVMHIPLRGGRFFNDHDTNTSRAVTVIDDTLASSLFPRQNPIGRILNIDTGRELWPMEIVGVAGHVRHGALDSDTYDKVRYQLYIPYLQIPDQFLPGFSAASTFVVRTGLTAASLVPAVKAQIADRDQPVYDVKTMPQLIGASLAQRHFLMLLLGVFAGIALLLASVGIYGVASYSVGQRTHEIGVRMALGARQDDVLRMVVRRAIGLAAAGVAIGLALAFGVTRAITNLLFGVTATDPATFAGVAVVLAAAALAASYIPARRAARVDPMAALRYE